MVVLLPILGYMSLSMQLLGPLALIGMTIAAMAVSASPLIEVVLLAASVGWSAWIARRVVRAVRSVGSLVTTMVAGQYRASVPSSGIREIDALMHGLNRVGEQVEAQLSELVLQAWRDPLTNLPNRAYLLDHLRQMNAQARRTTSSVAVLFVNLDDFKVVNASHGQRVGDEVLVAVARRLQECAGDKATVARLGGDEFAIVILDPDSERLAVDLAQRADSAFMPPLREQGREFFVRFSVGIAVSLEGRERPQELLRNADLAMAAAKAAGKARHALFDPEMNAHAQHRMRLEQELRDGLDRGEFRVYYQPLVELADGAFIEVEALVRWVHPERGLVSPAEFIPVAEETGLIVPLGRWVLHEACRQATEWDRSHPDNPRLIVGVNLSARQLLEPDLLDDVLSALAESGLPAERLKLEVTESLALDESATTTNALVALSRLGVRFAIDDFGTGQSGLSYLRRFPVSTLKLDQSFVSGMQANADDAAFVRGVVALAGALHLEITAEGIETSQQMDALRLLGCSIGQGYYFARPMPPDQLAEMLHHRPVAMAA
jgi:diguanylate cyclase (GGDEF)-like protein